VEAAKGCRTSGLCSVLSCCYLRYSPVVEEEDDCDLMFHIDSVHLTLKRHSASNLYVPYLSLVVSSAEKGWCTQREVKEDQTIGAD
jgi:hypothetical protein